MVQCVSTATGRRRLFWAHQDCSAQERCGDQCAQFGIAPGEGSPTGTAWVRGLAINILMTRGEAPGTSCGVTPGQRGGHWSQSFVDGQSFGSLLHTLKPSRSIRDSVAEIRAFATAALNKLVTYQVAQSIDVQVDYIGGGRVSLDVEIFGQDGSRSNVAISGSRAQNSWIWS